VTAQSANAIDTQQLAEYGEVGTQADERVEVTMSPSDVSTVQNISWVTDVRPVIRPEPAQTDTDIPGSSDGESGVQQAHENGITGEDVEVGIIDAGFDPNNQAIASNVVDTQSFRSSGGDPAHGTSVAEIVTQTAPDSQLYLVSASTGTDTEAAIDYLRRQGVDIIIHSVVFFAFEDNEDHIFTDNINAATESGTLFVNAAGNRAQTHWEGEFRDNNDNDNHEWTDGDELNCLPNCDTEYSGSIIVYVRWSDQDQESHYRPALFNPETDDFIRIGGERVFTTPSGTKYTVLTAEDVQSQPVDLVVDRVSGPADDEIEVVVDGPREIERNVPASSISAPADVSAALSVAAYEVGPRRLAPYSSRGPTDDGRTGIDVTGYTNIGVTNGFYDNGIFSGTSAAAPYVGGVAALIEENQAGDQSPTEVTNTLKSSSDDILDPGIDTASGSGVVNAADAVDVAEGTLTGEIRGQEDTLIEDVGLEVSLERQTTTGGFEQIRAPRQVSDGQYTFEGLATGEEYRVIAGFQGETGSATIESLSPGTNTRDVVIPEVTLAEETPPDVTQTVSSSEVAPGENVSVTTRISNLNGRDFDGNITYSPPVQSVKANATTTNGAVVDEFPLVENENTGSIGFGGFTDVEPRDIIIINQVATVSETAGTTHEVAGTITSGGTTAQIEPVTVTVTEQDSSSSSEIDVTRTRSSSEVSPDEQVTVTTEITGVSGAVSMSSSYDPQVASATVQSVTVNGASASPIIATAQSGGSVVTLGDVGTDATVTVTEKLTVGDETGVTHSITGNVTAGETTTEFDPLSVTVTDTAPVSVVDEYDTNNDGDISIVELGQAGQDFASGELTIGKLGEIGAAFAS
jgi:hypothetical protein